MKTIEDIDLKELIESETSEVCNRYKKIRSPFNSSDKTPSFSIYFNSNLNKWKFKDFSTGEEGDALDFITKYKNMDYVDARRYLGLPIDETESEKEIDLVKKEIDYEIKNWSCYKGWKLIGLFQYVDKENNPVYYIAKFNTPKGKKEMRHYHVENGKVQGDRGTEKALIYNLYNVCIGFKNNKTIIFTEGEKDANTLNSMLRNKDYVATSIKGVKETDLEFLKTNNLRAYVIGDTGKAGENYIKHITNIFKPIANEFKIINLPGLKQLGDNKDVTDWIEAGHTKEELLMAFKRSLDLKSMFELQQDINGIYKPIEDKETGNIKKIYFTDFQLVSAYRLNMVDEEKEGIKLVFKSSSGKEYEKIGSTNVFNDIRSFRNFLGTMDLNFLMDKTKDVVTLGKWINDFWAIDNIEIYKGVQFKPIGDNLSLITPQGAIMPKMFNDSFRTNDSTKISLSEVKNIQKEELIELNDNILGFISKEKALTIIGSIINNLCVYQCEELKISLHHLMIVGESGSGKSHILKRVIAPLLNLNESEIGDMGNTSKFALDKTLSTGNYTKIFDEFKPSMFTNQSKMKDLSGVLRNLYDRQTFSKGTKGFEVKSFRYSSPIVIAGEESYPNSEGALINRSAIVYVSRAERTKENSYSMEYLEDNEELLNKLGRSLIEKVINLPIEEYKELRNSLKDKFTLNDRALNTAINIAAGIEIYNKILADNNINPISDYYSLIEENLREEVLEGGDCTRSSVEQMLLLFDEIVENDRCPYWKDIVKPYSDKYMLIRSSELVNQLNEFSRKVGGVEVNLLGKRDFTKQAKKSGYKTTIDGKQRVCKRIFVGSNVPPKASQFDIYNREKIIELGCKSITGELVADEDKNTYRAEKVIDMGGINY